MWRPRFCTLVCWKQSVCLYMYCQMFTETWEGKTHNRIYLCSVFWWRGVSCIFILTFNPHLPKFTHTCSLLGVMERHPNGLSSVGRFFSSLFAFDGNTVTIFGGLSVVPLATCCLILILSVRFQAANWDSKMVYFSWISTITFPPLFFPPLKKCGGL